MNKWLLEAKKNENFPVLVELLEVFKADSKLNLYHTFVKLMTKSCQHFIKISGVNTV